MTLSEADTRAKLIDPALYRRGWTEDLIRREESAGAIDLVNAGYPPTVVQLLEQWDACDLFDVLAALGYDYAPRTRVERVAAFLDGETDWLAGLPEPTAATVCALAGQFGPGGTEALENRLLLDTPSVKQAGGISALRLAGNPAALMQETKRRLFGV